MVRTFPFSTLDGSLSRGRGAGPPTTFPVTSNMLPWQGHLNFRSPESQRNPQPRWGQIAENTTTLPSGSFTPHTIRFAVDFRQPSSIVLTYSSSSGLPGRSSSTLPTCTHGDSRRLNAGDRI